MSKFVKRFLSFVLALSFMFMVIPAKAAEDGVYSENASMLALSGESFLERKVDPSGVSVVPVSTTDAVFRRISIEELAAIFSSDPNAEDVQLVGDTLTYTLSNGNKGRIIETIENDGVATFTITEGNKTDVLEFDYTENAVSLNGGAVTARKTDVQICQNLTTASVNGVTWVQIGNRTYYDAYVENQIRNATASTLVTLITALVSPVGAIAISTAWTIINYFASLQSSAKYFYVGQELYYNAAIPGYHYLEKMYYYEDSEYETEITSSEEQIYT